MTIDLLATQVAHIYLALITLFVIVTFVDQYSLYYYCTLTCRHVFIILTVFLPHFKQYFCILYVLGNTCLKYLLKNLCIVLVFFSKSNANSTNRNLISSTAVSLLVNSLVSSSADFILCLYVSFIDLLVLKFDLSG